jgi:hypothetical protein
VEGGHWGIMRRRVKEDFEGGRRALLCYGNGMGG